MKGTGRGVSLKLGPGREGTRLDFHLQKPGAKLRWSLWSTQAPGISRGKGLGLALQQWDF